MKRIKTYKGFTVWAKGDNFAVAKPNGNFWEDLAANVKTAEKWIDAEVSASFLKRENPVSP